MDVDLSAPTLLDGAIHSNIFCDSAVDDGSPEKYLMENLKRLIDMQSEYAAIGSKILYAPTRGASRPLLEKYGLEDELEEINASLVKITKSVAKSDVAVAGVLGPTGLILEPFGETSFSEMIHIYREQASVLVNAGVDVLVIESMVSIAEARAAALAVRKMPVCVMLTMSLDENGETPYGGTGMSALVVLQELGISAFGLDSACGARLMIEDIESLVPYAKIPLIAKPSAFKFDDNGNKIGLYSPEEFAVEMKSLLEAGATIVGGSDGTTTNHLRAIKKVIDEHTFREKSEILASGDINLADIRHVYNLYCDQIECTNSIETSVDMADTFLELESESYDVIVVEINSIDEAEEFAKNAHFSTLPICFYSHDEEALRLALLLYNGRAMIDARSSIDKHELNKIAKKYGAVIY